LFSFFSFDFWFKIRSKRFSHFSLVFLDCDYKVSWFFCNFSLHYSSNKLCFRISRNQKNLFFVFWNRIWPF
jgi:hypothetical protein